MGLDISYYEKAELAPNGDEEDWERFNRVLVNPDFPGRGDDLQNEALYEVSGECGGFRAGSYGGYGQWRDMLARLAGYAPETGYRFEHANGAFAATGGPFWEMLNFSDCEGCIGPVTSAKRAKDFADFQDKADQHADSWFREKYADWRNAFETASRGGFVEFH